MTLRWPGWQRSVLYVAAVAVWLFAIDRHLMHGAKLGLAESDRAFNEGQLRMSLQAAERVSLALTPGSPFVPQGTARLRAIAVGSEASGRLRSALLAWSALAVTSFNQADGATGAIGAREAAQHVQALLPRRSDIRDAEGDAKGLVAPVAVVQSQLPLARAVSVLAALVLMGWVVFAVGPRRWLSAGRGLLRRMAVIAVGLAAALCWCIGWVFV